jgi:hypothetical protein
MMNLTVFLRSDQIGEEGHDPCKRSTVAKKSRPATYQRGSQHLLVEAGDSPVYQFSAAPDGGAFHVVRDFSPSNSFTWTPMQEGTYDIEVSVKDGYAATGTTSAVAVDTVASRVSGSEAVVTPTLNPLVALYSVPPSSADTVFVQFAVAGDHPAIRRVIRFCLVDARFGAAFDSMDICRSVLASFFVRTAAGQFEFHTPDDLVKLLVTMTRNKLASQARKERVGPQGFLREFLSCLPFYEAVGVKSESRFSYPRPSHRRPRHGRTAASGAGRCGRGARGYRDSWACASAMGAALWRSGGVRTQQRPARLVLVY